MCNFTFLLPGTFLLRPRHSVSTALLLLSIIFSSTLVMAQSALPAAGGTTSNNSGSVSYTVGNIFYSNATGVGGIVVPGVQQPFEISVVSALELMPDFELTMDVYPNPATDYLVLRSGADATAGMLYRLYSFSGELLQAAVVQLPYMHVPVQELQSGTYLLQVVAEGLVVKTFKIIKK